MNRISISLLLGYFGSVNGATVECNEQDYVDAQCDLTFPCTYDDAVQPKDYTCGTEAEVCTDNTSCTGTNLCGTGDPKVCVLCTDNGAPSCENNGQCITSGTIVGSCSLSNACLTPGATTDECNIGSYCYENTDTSALTCQPDCSSSADCSDAAIFEADSVCQTLNSTNMCTAPCSNAASCSTISQTALCGTADTASYGYPEGVCFEPVCSEDTDCTTQDQTCNNGVCTWVSCDPSVTTYSNSACAATNTVCYPDNGDASASTGTCRSCTAQFMCKDDSGLVSKSYSCVIADGETYGQCMMDQCTLNEDFENFCEGVNGYTCNNAQMCDEYSQIVYRNCDADGQCPSTGICQNGKCALCDGNQGDTGSSLCPAGYTCNTTNADFQYCYADCSSDANCATYETCSDNGLCVGRSCTVGGTDQCSVAATGTGATTETSNGVCDSSSTTCVACTSKEQCGDGSFCSDGVADANGIVYESGTCYTGECGSDTDCTDMTQYCNNGLCETQTCVANTDCTRTNFCNDGTCSTCSISGTGDTAESNCPLGLWCSAETDGICETGSGTTCRYDDACNGKDLICNNQFQCEKQKCTINADCVTNLCSDQGECLVCQYSAPTESDGTGGIADTCTASNPATYCDTDSTICFFEECVGADSTPPQFDNCVTISETCQRGKCAKTDCSAGNMGACRSQVNGEGTAGVCNTTNGECQECERGNPVYNGDPIYNNCPGLYNFCHMYTNEAEVLAGLEPELIKINQNDGSGLEAYCERASCTPFHNMYEDMDKQIPDAYDKCESDYFCDYEYTGTCQRDKCMNWEDCVQTNFCDFSDTTGEDEFPYYCRKCSTHDDCPATPECIDDIENEYYDAECNTNPFVCMETGACTQQVVQNLETGVTVGIVAGTIVFVTLVVLFILCCRVNKKNISKDAPEQEK